MFTDYTKIIIKADTIFDGEQNIAFFGRKFLYCSDN